MGRKAVKPETIGQARDPVLPLSLVAIRRAAKSAWETALRTHTALIVVKEGMAVRIEPGRIQEESGQYGVDSETGLFPDNSK
jgi:hypothetical protein